MTYPICTTSYAIKKIGITLATISSHVNPAGPLAYVWIGTAGAVLGGKLWSFRLVNLISFLVLGALLLWLMRKQRAWLPATCMLLLNPYAPLASATILTEVPTLLFLISGGLLWTAGLSESSTAVDRSQVTSGIVKLLIGGMLIGLAITGRQYFLATLPAMAVTFLSFWVFQQRHMSPTQLVAVMVSGALAAGPIAILFLIWGGLTPPSMQTNISEANLTARVGINMLRPSTAAIYLGLYVLPILVLQTRQGLNALGKVFGYAAAITSLLLVLAPHGRLLCESTKSVTCGPVSWIYEQMITVSPNFAECYAGGVILAGSTGLLMLLRGAWLDRALVQNSTLAVYGISFVFFFLIEQLFVSGNIPFYERYILQIAPVVGLTMGSDRKFRADRAVIGSIPLVAYGFFCLWRYI